MKIQENNIQQKEEELMFRFYNGIKDIKILRYTETLKIKGLL